MLSHEPEHFRQTSLAEYMDNARIALSITSCELDDYPLIYVNQPFCEMTGYSADQVKGRNCRFMQRELREQYGRFRMHEFLADAPQDRMRCALVNYRADGSPFVNLVHLARIRNANKKQCFIFASQFDATHDVSKRLNLFDTDLGDAARAIGNIASEHDLMMDQSIDIIANSARMIAESKLTLKSLEAA